MSIFCPKCGSLLRPKMKGSQRVFGCSCGYVADKADRPNLTEKGGSKEEIHVIEKEVETYPLINADCPKCKHAKAYFWTMQTRAADEAETRFFKCEKCKHIWREYQ